MSRIDQNVYKAVCSENKSRVDFFLKNADKLYAQAKVVDSKFKKRLATLQREIEQASKQHNQITEDQRKVSDAKSNFDRTKDVSDIGKRFPELSDPRCFTHSMRPIPIEHLAILYGSTDGHGTELYLKKRWSIPPKERFYLPESSNWDYGWNKREPSNETFYGRVFSVKRHSWRKNGLAMFVNDKQLPARTFL